MAIARSEARKAAVALHQSGALEAAVQAYRAYLKIYPDDAGHWSNLGVALRSLDRHIEARAAQMRALDIDPESSTYITNAANILSDIGEYDASIALREKALALDPGNSEHLAMIGRCLRAKGDYAGAIRHLEAARAKRPDVPELQLQRAFAHLAQGDYKTGFQDFSVRWADARLPGKPAHVPLWAGDALSGKSVLVLPEQGLGDVLLAMRFLPALSGSGAYFLVQMPRALRRLFQDLPHVQCIDKVDISQVQVDFCLPIMDLARVHFAQDRTVPPPAVLTIPDDARPRVARLMKPFHRHFKVGIVWAGAPTYRANCFRSISHTALLPLADIPGVKLFSLYKGVKLDRFLNDDAAKEIVDVGSTDRDLADCAAAMEQMDLIITTDTATAHLAGSLRRPVWILLHWDPFWLWGHTSESSVWYPTMRLFRQQAPLDWNPVIKAVCDSLKLRLECFE